MTVGVRRKLIVKDKAGERDVLLIGTVSVGRDPSCDISANDPALSRHHAEFLETPRGILVRDLRSQNGIKVNNVTVREAVLQPGDVITVAALVLRYAEDGLAPEPPSEKPPETAPLEPFGTVVLSELPSLDNNETPPLVAPLAPQAPRAAAVAPPSPPREPVASFEPAAPPAVAPGALASEPEPEPEHAADAAGSAIDALVAEAPPPAIDDSTRVMAPPVHIPPPPKPAAAAPGKPLADLIGVPPKPAVGDSDRTNMMAMPPPIAAAPSPGSGADARATSAMAVPSASPAAPAAPTRPRVSATQRAAQELAATKVKPATQSSWAARVLLRMLLLTLVVSLLSAVPLMIWHQQQMNAVTVSRANALVNLLAADASLALNTGDDIENAPKEVLAESGVIAARILNLDGSVLAPASRSAETIATIPGINAAPNDILRLRSEWNGDRFEVARPVSAKGKPRAALAWVTLTPTTEFNGSSLVVTAPVVVISLLLGWIVAMMLTRSTLRGFSKLNEDIELALSAGTEAVRDPLGAKPLTDLTNTINYLLARLRGLGDDAHSPGLGPGAGPGHSGPAEVRDASRKSTLHVAVPSAPSPVTPPVVLPPSREADPPTPAMGTPPPPPRPVAAPSPSPRPSQASASSAPASGTGGSAAGSNAGAGSGTRAASAAGSGAAGAGGAGSGAEARLLVDTGFLVTEASPGCATLLGVRPDALVGRHLLDAIADRQIADAVLGCLSALPPAGERQGVATDGAGRRLAATVSRPGKDKPITITIRIAAAES